MAGAAGQDGEIACFDGEFYAAGEFATEDELRFAPGKAEDFMGC